MTGEITHKQEKLNGTWWASSDGMPPPAVTLTFDLLIAKANQHICEPKYICDQNWAKFFSLVFRDMVFTKFSGHCTTLKQRSHHNREVNTWCQSRQWHQYMQQWWWNTDTMQCRAWNEAGNNDQSWLSVSADDLCCSLTNGHNYKNISYIFICIYTSILLPTHTIIWLMIKWNKLRCFCTKCYVLERKFLNFVMNEISDKVTSRRDYCFPSLWMIVRMFYTVHCLLHISRLPSALYCVWCLCCTCNLLYLVYDFL